MQKILKYFCVIYLLFIIGNLLSGCATVPTVPGLPTYSLNGGQYVSLVDLCNAKGFLWQYDSFARTVALQKGSHSLNLRVGDSFLLVDGKPVTLARPVDLLQGMVVVPVSFQDQLKAAENIPAVVCPIPPSNIHTIVIDAGHGGYDPGAISRTGLREKEVNLDIARRLAELLTSSGYKVVMTRTGDEFIPLSGRVNIANAAKADLFISIHANANRARAMNGLEVYYVSSTVSDAMRAAWAARNMPLPFDRSSFADNSLDLKTTLWDMMYTNARAESVALARSICDRIEREMCVKVLGIKQARYYVLRGAGIPAVLVETGFLTNCEEEQQLKCGPYRQKLAQALFDGIQEYAGDTRLVQQ